MTTFEEELDKLVVDLVWNVTADIPRQNIVESGRVKEAITAIKAATLRRLPEKPSNTLIQNALQNGKPQLAASYNGYAAAIQDMKDNLNV
jgi:hypothetical protein